MPPPEPELPRRPAESTRMDDENRSIDRLRAVWSCRRSANGTKKIAQATTMAA
jgi:hypothetical protein